MQFDKPVRQILTDIIFEYRRHLPDTLFAGDEWTVPDGDLEGTLFDTLAVQDDRLVLTAHEGTYSVSLDEAPVSTGALAAVAGELLRKEWEENGRILFNGEPFYELLSTDIERLLYTIKENRLWLDPRRASERQVFECLLALGGPHSTDDLYDDGCGELYLGDDCATLPFVFTGDGNGRFFADEISWVAERASILMSLRNSATGQEARFVVLPDTSKGIHNAPDAPEEQCLHGLRNLEGFLLRELRENLTAERREQQKREREQPREGELYVLAIRDILLKRSEARTCHSFKRNSYEYQADMPHITAWWGGPAAVDTVYLNPDFQDSIVIYCFPLCGLSHYQEYSGNEPGVPWDRLFSEIYSHLQGAEDPEWEEWLETNRTRLVTEEMSHEVYKGVTLPEDGIPAECLLPRPSTPRATLLSACIAGPDDEDFPEGTPVFGVDLGGQPARLTPDDLDFNELFGLYLLLRDCARQEDTQAC